MQLPLCSNAYDDVTDFEKTQKHKNIDISRTKHFFSSNKKIY